MSFLKKSGTRSDAEVELANGHNQEDAVDAEKQTDGKWVIQWCFLFVSHCLDRDADDIQL